MAAPAAPPANALAELAPLLRRALALDPAGVVRLRIAPGEASALIRLPFGVLVGRRIPGDFQASHDATYPVGELLEWIDSGGQRAAEAVPLPPPRDDAWRGARPPDSGWRRVETVPDTVVRDLVRRGALTLKEAAEREGLPGAQPRAEVADALLDSTVLTADTDDAGDTGDPDRAGGAADPDRAGGERVEVSLRLLSALVRMGFLARDSHLAVDIAARWLRLAASYGSVYAERGGLGLGALRPRPNPHGGVGR